MTFPWRQLPWLQNKEHPNLGRSTENDSADTQGFGRKVTEGQWITWGSQEVKHPMYTNWLEFLLEWPSARVVSATKITKLVWPSGHIWVSAALTKSMCSKPARAAQLSHPWESSDPAQPGLQHLPTQSKCSNTGSQSQPITLTLPPPQARAAGTAGLPKGRIVSTASTLSTAVGFYLVQSALFRTNPGRTVTLAARLFGYLRSSNSRCCSTTNAAAQHYLANTGIEWITAPWKL